MKVSDILARILGYSARDISRDKVMYGRLNNRRGLFGWNGDFELEVDGERFYKKIHLPFDRSCVDGVAVGDRVKVIYEEKRTSLLDQIGDIILFAGWGIPKSYREVIKVERA